MRLRPGRWRGHSTDVEHTQTVVQASGQGKSEKTQLVPLSEVGRRFHAVGIGDGHGGSGVFLALRHFPSPS